MWTSRIKILTSRTRKAPGKFARAAKNSKSARVSRRSVPCSGGAPAVRRVYDAWRSDSGEAAALQESISAHRAALQSQPLIPTLKRLLARERDDPAWLTMRPPLGPMSEAAAAEQDAALAAAGFEFGA